MARQLFAPLLLIIFGINGVAGEVASNADVDRGTLLDFLEEYDPQRALIVASREGKLDYLKRLLKEGIDPNWQNKDQDTALSVAVQYHQFEAVLLLLDHGACPYHEKIWYYGPKENPYSIVTAESIILMAVEQCELKVQISFSILRALLKKAKSNSCTMRQDSIGQKVSRWGRARRIGHRHISPEEIAKSLREKRARYAPTMGGYYGNLCDTDRAIVLEEAINEVSSSKS